MLPRTANQFSRRIARLAATAVAAITLLFSFHSPAQDLARRLILKDGSYQLVKSYEMRGDRVHYLSAERNEWEELPSSLVDWPATEKYEKDRAAGASVPEAAQLDRDLDAERELEEASLPQVAPGLRLPEDSGVFLLDNYKGEPQLLEVQQTAGDLNRNTKGNILRATINPIASARQTIELEGAHAAVQSHVGVPSIYLKIDSAPGDDHQGKDSREKSADDSARDATPQPQRPQQPEQAIVPFDRFRIVRADVKGGKRILGAVKRAITGNVSQEQHLAKSTIDRVSGGWLKITPTESLAPGEYAVVEMLGKEGMNLYVWDFGVNPNAPANANPWKPEAKSAKPAETHP
jgi:hypothetical protein